MFSIITIASSTTKPVPIVSAISERLSRLKPIKYITPNVPISDNGSATPAMIVARIERRKASTTSTTSTTDSISVNCTSAIDALIVPVRSLTIERSTPAGNCTLQLVELGTQPRDGLHDVGAGLALHVDDDGGLALVPAGDMRVLEPVDDVGDIRDQHRRAVAIGDDDVLVGVGGLELIVRADRIGLLDAVERALGTGDIGVGDRGAQVLHADPVVGEARQIGLDAHRRLDAAEDPDVADAGDLGESLAD